MIRERARVPSLTREEAAIREGEDQSSRITTAMGLRSMLSSKVRSKEASHFTSRSANEFYSF